MVKDSGDEHYVANKIADVPLGCQSAFWMPCFKDGRIVVCLLMAWSSKGEKLMAVGEKRVTGEVSLS